MSKSYTTTVLSVDRGTEHNAATNTDWPLTDVVVRFGPPGRRPVWTAAKGVTNGRPCYASRNFRSLEAAKAWLGA
jgi:hypothetical protein